MSKKINMREIDIKAAEAREALETEEAREAALARQEMYKQQAKEKTANMVKEVAADDEKEAKRVAKKRQLALEAGEPRIITEIQKNKREKIIISVNEYGGHKFVDLRIHYTDGESPVYKPTRKGITIKPAISQQVINAIHEASNQIKKENATASK